MENVKTLIEKENYLFSYEGEDRVVSSFDIRKIIEADGQQTLAFKSGFPLLDEVVGGFEGGELTTISGTTGNGKSLLAMSLTRYFNFQNIFSLWFSYELMPKQFLRAFGNILPVFYMPLVLKLNTLDWLEHRVWEAKLKYNCRAVFIDHLHFLVDMRSKNNMSLEIGYTMRSLKKMALKYNVCIFLIAHTGKINSDKELDIDDIRDSSFTGQESDNVLMVWRRPVSSNQPYENQAYLKVVKNRKFGTFRKILLEKNEDGFLQEVWNSGMDAGRDAKRYSPENSRFKD